MAASQSTGSVVSLQSYILSPIPFRKSTPEKSKIYFWPYFFKKGFVERETNAFLGLSAILILSRLPMPACPRAHFCPGRCRQKNMTRPVNHPFCYGADCRTPFCAIASTKVSTAISLMADALWRGDGGVNRWRNGVLNDCTLGPPRCIGPICVCETKDSRDFAFVSADQFCSQLQVNCSNPGCSWAHLPINIH